MIYAVTNIKSMLFNLGLGHFWENQNNNITSNVFLPIVKQRIYDVAIQTLEGTRLNSP